MEMISHFFLGLNNYLTSFGIITLILFLLLILISLKLANPYIKPKKDSESFTRNNSKEPKLSMVNKDLKGIAGEDLMSTQLDLARAYIEMDEKKIAKTILDHVKQKGNLNQQKEAERLILSL